MANDPFRPNVGQSFLNEFPYGIAPKGKLDEKALLRLSQLFFEGAQRQRERFDPITQAFLSQVSQPGALFESAQRAAEARAQELFAPRGEVSNLISRARGQVIGQGFAPEAALGAENSIISQALKQVSSTFAQQAAALEQSRLQSLGGAFQEGLRGERDLLESYFNAVATALQAKYAKPGFFGRLFS